MCFTQLGRHAEAAAELDALPAWSEEDPYVLYARACILWAAGRIEEARELVDRASKRDPALYWISGVDPLPRLVGSAEP